MARIEFQDNLEEEIGQLEGLRRGAVKRIVIAGADACAEAEKQAKKLAVIEKALQNAEKAEDVKAKINKIATEKYYS